MNKIKNNLIAFILPVTVFSTQGGTTMQNTVETSGNSDVYVESTLNQSSIQKSDVSVSNSATTTSNNSDSKTNTKMEITVNGKTKTLQTNEPGFHKLEINESSESATALQDLSGNDAQFKGETLSIGQYIRESIQNFFNNFFSRFGKR